MSSVAAPAITPGRTVRFSRLSDDRLARLVENGGERAFATLYERYHQQLYRYCRSILLNDSDAQDALQSTFAAALSAMQRGKRNAPVRPWLFRIAHNEAVSLIRRRRAGDSAPADELASAVAAGSVETMVDDRARLELLIADLRELPDRQRSALVMRELSGLSHEEIAIALGTSLGAAKQAIFDARCALQEYREGRAMPCDEVLRAISDGDGRVLRARRVRAHLRDCARCSVFADSIPMRQAQLRALAPGLPTVASVALLARALRGAPAHGGPGASGTATAGAAGKTIAAAVASKAVVGATVLVTAAAGVGGVTAVLHTTGQQAAASRTATTSGSAARPGSVVSSAAVAATGARHAAARLAAGRTLGSSTRRGGSSHASVAQASSLGSSSSSPGRGHRISTPPGQTKSPPGHTKTPHSHTRTPPDQSAGHGHGAGRHGVSKAQHVPPRASKRQLPRRQPK